MIATILQRPNLPSDISLPSLNISVDIISYFVHHGIVSNVIIIMGFNLHAMKFN